MKDKCLNCGISLERLGVNEIHFGCAELTKLKADVVRLRRPQEFVLQRITTPMAFAVRVEIAEDKDGRIFKFVDHTGHPHGYFQEGNPLSSVPENVAGVSKYDGWWFWVIRALEETKP